jgi:hypothetical protein
VLLVITVPVEPFPRPAILVLLVPSLTLPTWPILVNVLNAHQGIPVVLAPHLRLGQIVLLVEFVLVGQALEVRQCVLLEPTPA